MKNSFTIILLVFCAYIQAQIGVGTTSPNSTLDVRGSSSNPITTFSTNTTAGSSDNMFLFTGTSAATLTLPTAVGITGREYWIKNISSNSSVLTIATTSAQTIDGISTWPLTQTNKTIRVVSNGTNWYAAAESLPGSTGTPWVLGGNNVSSVQNIGTTSNYDLPFLTNNTEKMRLTATGSLGIGSATFNSSYPEKLLVDAGTSGNTNYQNVIVGKGNTNSYAQLNIQNMNAGTGASSDVVATADNGNETTNYVDMGINSSGNTNNYFGSANDAYLYNLGQNFMIGTGTAGKVLAFLTGGGTQSTNERMRIDGSGNVGIGTTSPGSTLDIKGTLRLSGSTSGYIGFSPAATAGSTTYTLPSADGISGQALTTNGSGTLSWVAPTASNWSLIGNSGTIPGTNFIGTTDNTALHFKINNVARMHMDVSGGLYVGDSASSYANTVTNTQAGLRSDWTTSLLASDTPRIALQGQMRVNLSTSSIANQVRGFNGSAIVGVNNGVSSNADVFGGYFLARRQTSSTITEGNGTLTTLGGAGIEYGHTATANSGGTTTNVYGIKLNPFYAAGTITNLYGIYASAPSTGGAVTNSYDIYLASHPLTGVTNAWGIYQANIKNNYLAGSVGIGSSSFNATYPEKLLADAGASGNTNYQNVIVGKGNTNSYAQLNIQNSNAGTSASSDVVATADNGNETVNFIDMGVNSSAYSSTGILAGINNTYLYSTGNDMLIGNATASKDLVLFTGGTATTNERLRATANGITITGSHVISYRSGIGNYTLLATDYVVINTSTAATWTLPDPTTCAGRVYRLLNQGTGSITLSRTVRTASGTTSTTLVITAGSNFL